MRRRTFMQSALAGSAAALAAPTQGIPKRTYKGDVKVSMIAFGGIVVVGMEQKDAGRAVAEAFDRGVNYFDVAPSYFSGEALPGLRVATASWTQPIFCVVLQRCAHARRRSSSGVCASELPTGRRVQRNHQTARLGVRQSWRRCAASVPRIQGWRL